MKDVARQAAAKVFQDYDEEGRESFQREVADAVAVAVLQKIVGEMPMSNIDRAHVFVRSLLAEFSAPEGRPEPSSPQRQDGEAGIAERLSRLEEMAHAPVELAPAIRSIVREELCCCRRHTGNQRCLQCSIHGLHPPAPPVEPSAPVTPEPPPMDSLAAQLRAQCLKYHNRSPMAVCRDAVDEDGRPHCVICRGADALSLIPISEARPTTEGSTDGK